jgi:hypothetical protein
MGKRFDALAGEIREAVKWIARRNMEEFGQRHPELASITLSPSTIAAVQEDFAGNADLEDVLARYKAAYDLKADTSPRSSEPSELSGHPSDASPASQGDVT